jgi:hypothetical protein
MSESTPKRKRKQSKNTPEKRFSDTPLTWGDEKEFRENPGDTAPGFSLVAAVADGGEVEAMTRNIPHRTTPV